MKKSTLLISVLLLVFHGSLLGEFCWFERGSDCECQKGMVYGDYLFWSTRRCSLDYAVPDNGAAPTTLSIGETSSVDPTYASGFRVGGMRMICSWDLGLHYTWFRARNRDSVFREDGALGGTRQQSVQSIIVIPAGFIEAAEAEYSVDLDVAQVECGTQWSSWCGNTWRLFGGFEFARIDQTFDVEYRSIGTPPPFVLTHLTTCLNAYGLYVGVEGAQKFCTTDGWADAGLFGKFSFGTFVGDIRREHCESTVASNGFRAVQMDQNDHCYRPIANLNGAVGVFLTPRCIFACAYWDLFLGYEFHFWFNAADFLTDNQQNPSSNTFFRNRADIGFDGLFVRLKASF